MELKRLDPCEEAEHLKSITRGLGATQFELPSSVSPTTKNNGRLSHEVTALGVLLERAGCPRDRIIHTPDIYIDELVGEALGFSRFQSALFRILAIAKKPNQRDLITSALVSPQEVVGPRFAAINDLVLGMEDFGVQDWEQARVWAMERSDELADNSLQQVLEAMAVETLRGEVLFPQYGAKLARAAFSYAIMGAKQGALGFQNHATDLVVRGPYAANYLQVTPQGQNLLTGRVYLEIFTGPLNPPSQVLV